MIRIFLFAPMGAGKDEAAAYLAREHGFASVALADGIRRYIRECSPHYTYKSDRALEIEVGEAHRRWFGPDYWCKVAEQRLKMSVSLFNPRGYVISDGRFSHEYDYFVRERGYIPVKIVADDTVRKERLLKRDGIFNLDQFNNPRDCEIRDFPAAYTLENNGDLDALYTQIDAMIDDLSRGRAFA